MMTEKVPNRKIFNEFENYLVIERRFPLNNNIIGIPELFFQGAFFRRSGISPLILMVKAFLKGLQPIPILATKLKFKCSMVTDDFSVTKNLIKIWKK